MDSQQTRHVIAVSGMDVIGFEVIQPATRFICTFALSLKRTCHHRQFAEGVNVIADKYSTIMVDCTDTVDADFIASLRRDGFDVREVNLSAPLLSKHEKARFADKKAKGCLAFNMAVEEKRIPLGFITSQVPLKLNADGRWFIDDTSAHTMLPALLGLFWLEMD